MPLNDPITPALLADPEIFQQNRLPLDHPNVKAANVAKDRNFRVLDQCHNNSNDHGKGKRNDRQRYRYCDAFELLRDSIE